MFGAFVFDLLGTITSSPALWTTGAHLALAGVATGVVAAVPGFVDFVFTVPPDSSGKKRALRHMASMISAMALFALARWLRGDAAVPPDLLILGLETVGVIALGIGGWMGGTLVTRNQVSVDHRYANAGKWGEETIDEPLGDDPITVDAGDLGANQMRLLRIGSRRIVLGRTEGGYVAFDDHCTHRGGSLAGGVMICGTVQCPWHGSQFDVVSGQVKAGPARDGISVYRIETSGNKLRLFGVARV